MMKINGDLKVDGSIFTAGSPYSVGGSLTTVQYDNTATGDQSTSGLSGTDIDITGLTGKSFPGTPAAADTYLVTVTVGYNHDDNHDAIVKLWVGTNGSTADTTPVMQSSFRARPGVRVTVSTSFVVTLSTGSELVGASINLSSGSGTATGISGGGVITAMFSFMEILKLA